LVIKVFWTLNKFLNKFCFQEMTDQARQLADKPHIVIATPGRLADHLESGTNFSLNKIQFLGNKFNILFIN
jgi:hypothetical protein